MKKLFLFIHAIFIFSFAFGQNLGIKWTKYLTPTFATGEIIFESQQTDDGGHILAGIDTSFDYNRNNVIYNKYTQGTNQYHFIVSLKDHLPVNVSGIRPF